MTNMQHYMDDIHDIMEGLNVEIERRLKRIGKWDAQIEEWTEESKKLDEYIFDESKPQEKRDEKALRLAELRGKMRALTERKVQLSEKSQNTVHAIYKKMSALAYHCKCEVEIDNPGSTELRERLFVQMNGYAEIEADHADGQIHISANDRRTREMSIMTDEDSGKKGGGRSRAVFKDNKSNYSSARSSVERENGKKGEKMSSYMRRKNEKMKEQQRIDEEMQFEKEKLDLIKRELLDGTDFDWGGESSSTGIGRVGITEEEEEQELLRFLIPENDGRLPSPPRDIMESLEATDTGMFSMDWSNEKEEIKPMSSMTNLKRPNASSSPFDLAEKRKRNLLFGSIADTSFSGRPRKLTDRVSEMMQNSREREEKRMNRKKENDEWCICDGNINSEMMVQCDNANCKIEWYHFECVGLLDSPFDTWYCPTCSQIPPMFRLQRPKDE